MPPMFVFPQKRDNTLLLDDAPPGEFAFYHESEWIDEESFITWLFIDYSHPSSENMHGLHGQHSLDLIIKNIFVPLKINK